MQRLSTLHYITTCCEFIIKRKFIMSQSCHRDQEFKKKYNGNREITRA